ncbi:unnamed protein product, partial [Ectocarpus sp. 13 AM-2016]
PGRDWTAVGRRSCSRVSERTDAGHNRDGLPLCKRLPTKHLSRLSRVSRWLACGAGLPSRASTSRCVS